MKKIYVVEDDDNIRDLLKIALEGFGYQVKAFETAEESLSSIDEDSPDMAIFDWMLPGMDGISAIKIIRQKDKLKDIPIIVLTAKDKELDKVIGLDGGADDYITKPFSILELGARIRSAFRRVKDKDEENTYIYAGNLKINIKTREVYKDNCLIELTYKEYELLLYLLENKNRVVSREELLNRVWGYTYTGETRTLDMHIRTLRQKLGDEANEYIKTVRAVGYRFNA